MYGQFCAAQLGTGLTVRQNNFAKNWLIEGPTRRKVSLARIKHLSNFVIKQYVQNLEAKYLNIAIYVKKT